MMQYGQFINNVQYCLELWLVSYKRLVPFSRWGIQHHNKNKRWVLNKRLVSSKRLVQPLFLTILGGVINDEVKNIL